MNFDSGAVKLQVDLDHGLRIRDLLPTAFDHTLLERLCSCVLLFAFGATLNGFVGYALATVDLGSVLASRSIRNWYGETPT
jgi:hypothetical protein